MVPICSVDRTLIVSYRQAQALGCLICIIPCSAFSFFSNKEQYKEWELKIQVMLSGRIMDLFCTKMPVLLVCLLQAFHGHAAVGAPETKPQLWACLWVLGREIFPLCCFYPGGNRSRCQSSIPTRPHKQRWGRELWDKLETSRLPTKSSPSTEIQSLNGTWGFVGKKPVKHASTALHICEEA